MSPKSSEQIQQRVDQISTHDSKKSKPFKIDRTALFASIGLPLLLLTTSCNGKKLILMRQSKLTS